MSRTLQQINDELDKISKREKELFEEMYHNSEYIKNHFSSLKISNEDKYLSELIEKITFISKNYNNITYTMDNQHYMIEFQMNKFWYYTNGKDEKSTDEEEYQEYEDASIYPVIREAFKVCEKHLNKKGFLNNYLKQISEKEPKISDFMIVGLLLCLSKFINI